MFETIHLIPIIPLIGFLINGLFGKKIQSEKIISSIGILAVGIPFLIAFGIFISILQAQNFQPITKELFTWITVGNLDISKCSSHLQNFYYLKRSDFLVMILSRLHIVLSYLRYIMLVGHKV